MRIFLPLVILVVVAISYGYQSNDVVKENTTHQTKPLQVKTHRYKSDTQRYHFDIRTVHAQIPYASNMRLSDVHTEVRHLIVAIHSSSYNPDTYLNNALSLFESGATDSGKTLIVAPAFFRKDKTKLSDIVTWDVSPFWGSSRASYHKEKVELSAYEVLDDLLRRIIGSKNFPNLSDIVILGHSAGGQMVTRYAACNTIEDTEALKHHISMRYLVMAPSSYLYMDGRRAKRSDHTVFEFPFGAHKQYNNWGYGLKHLYAYHKRNHITADNIRWNYKYRKVLYLVGELDTKDFALDKSKSAMLEGSNRLERMEIYYDYLKTCYGDEITDHHSMSVVPHVGHSGRALMHSAEGRKFILGQ
ncbi:MAG: hypothetical protein DSZ10_02260 [Sulfurovum sp.]|nr:MAG: hypothetical protein DSZ10_02260 [Sulfurovum sp.]